MTYKGLCVFSIFALFTLLGTNQSGGQAVAGRRDPGISPGRVERPPGQAVRRVGAAPLWAGARHCHVGRSGLQCPQLSPLPKPWPCEQWQAQDEAVAP
jgi:hypothetical protein